VPCAPSHPLHVMPSRITRNSHRPRASDRTMVASKAPVRLSLSRTRARQSPSAEELRSMENNFFREVKLRWAECRETISASGRGGAFFLTFLFIELIDRRVLSLWVLKNSISGKRSEKLCVSTLKLWATTNSRRHCPEVRFWEMTNDFVERFSWIVFVC
jgi:hypothetical protein